ncbi:GtrA family protein [Candidatus Saccharibacteria bacterium]|nr:GtrA family protein [Candidatus Saccharibacteria bacterium]
MKSEAKQAKKTADIKVSKRAGRYLIVGITLTLFNYGLYAILANVIFNNQELIWLSTLISTVATTFLAYFLHSKITWKERDITKAAIYKFFIWNAILAFAIGPWITQLFSYITPLYDLAYNICQAIHINFTYEFVQTTGAFVLASAVIMVINFLFYDKFVFGEKPNKEEK